MRIVLISFINYLIYSLFVSFSSNIIQKQTFTKHLYTDINMFCVCSRASSVCIYQFYELYSFSSLFTKINTHFYTYIYEKHLDVQPQNFIFREAHLKKILIHSHLDSETKLLLLTQFLIFSSDAESLMVTSAKEITKYQML